jgi:hypothetical protein
VRPRSARTGRPAVAAHDVVRGLRAVVYCRGALNQRMNVPSSGPQPVRWIMRGLKQPCPVPPQVACQVRPVDGSVDVVGNSSFGVDHGPCGLDAVDTPKPHQGVLLTYHW